MARSARQLLKVRRAATVLLAVVLLSPQMTRATPLDDFYSDEFLGMAMVDVSEMELDDLERFIDLLASCNVAEKDEVQKFHCQRSQASFDIRYLPRNSLTDLMNILPVIEMRLEGLDNAPAGSEKRQELVKLWMRSLDIYRKLADAARIYYGLAKQPKR